MGKIVEIGRSSAAKTVPLRSSHGTLIDLPKVADYRGTLTFIEDSKHATSAETA
jgi:hypothetical protein